MSKKSEILREYTKRLFEHIQAQYGACETDTEDVAMNIKNANVIITVRSGLVEAEYAKKGIKVVVLDFDDLKWS